MKAAKVVVVIAGALALQTTLFARGSTAIDLVLIVVVFTALTSGPAAGLVTGTVAGLAYDALSATGVIGIGGLAKTVVGFVTGAVGTQFIVTRPLTRFVVFFLATLLHEGTVIGLDMVLTLGRFGVPYGAVLRQAVGNGLVGTVVFQLIELLPGVIERRRIRAGARVTRRLGG